MFFNFNKIKLIIFILLILSAIITIYFYTQYQNKCFERYNDLDCQTSSWSGIPVYIFIMPGMFAIIYSNSLLIGIFFTIAYIYILSCFIYWLGQIIIIQITKLLK